MGLDKFHRMIASPGVIRYMDKRITVAQVLALFTTPITLVPAPKTGWCHIFEGALLFKAAGTAYTIGTGGNIEIHYNNASGVAVAAIAPNNSTAFMDATTVQSRWLNPYRAASGDSGIVPAAAVPLVICQATANMTGGTNAVVTARTFYRTIPYTV